MLRVRGLGLGVTLAAALVATTGVAAASAPPVQQPVFQDGKAQPVYDGDDVIRRDVWVEVPADTDHNGKPDRVHVEVARPAATEHGVDLPVIMQASPYYGGGNPITNHDVDVPLYVPDKPGRDIHGPDGDRDGKPSRKPDAVRAFTGSPKPSIGPSRYEQYFLPRGFAFVYAESIGTGHSTGCPTIGGEKEILGIESVVDWLNGRAQAYSARTGASQSRPTGRPGRQA